MGFGGGGDSSGACGTAELSAAVAEFPVSCPSPDGSVGVPVGQNFGFGPFGWYVHVFGQPPGKQGSCRDEELPFFFPADFDELGVVDFGGCVVHGYVDAYLVEGSDEGLSLVGVGAVSDHVFDAWCDLEGLEGE